VIITNTLQIFKNKYLLTSHYIQSMINNTNDAINVIIYYKMLFFREHTLIFAEPTHFTFLNSYGF
jgi:hypothetical protein